MDGTLLDSMGFWRCLGRIYLKSLGVEAGEEVDKKLLTFMTMEEGAAYIKSQFDLKLTAQEIHRDMWSLMDRHYADEAPLKPQVRSYLDKLKAQGAPMAVFTTTPLSLAEPALRRLGLVGYFQFLMDSSNGQAKSDPKTFLTVTSRLGVKPQEVEVYEDALYAVKSAKAAGLFVTAIADPWAKQDEEELRRCADRYIEGWQDLLED